MGHFGKQFTGQLEFYPLFYDKTHCKGEHLYFSNLAVIFFSHNTKWVSGRYPLGIMRKKSQKIAQFKAMSSPCGWVLWELGPPSAPPHRVLNPIKTLRLTLHRKTLGLWFEHFMFKILAIK
jgi:hypothetical protein